MLDEFVLSARGKVGLRPSLVLLLPHGYEGQGPDHASARPERFLQLAADINMRVANCTTAAQYFHLLRRQAAARDRSPAARGPDAEEPVASPDGRGRATRSRRATIPAGDRRRGGRASGPGRAPRAFCSGKIFVDL